VLKEGSECQGECWPKQGYSHTHTHKHTHPQTHTQTHTQFKLTCLAASLKPVESTCAEADPTQHSGLWKRSMPVCILAKCARFFLSTDSSYIFNFLIAPE